MCDLRFEFPASVGPSVSRVIAVDRARHSRLLRGVVLGILLCTFAGMAFGAEKGVGFQISGFSADDNQTEQIFDVDSGPVAEVFFRFQTGAHAFVGSLGFHNWSREDGTTSAELDFIPLSASYRYVLWREKPVSPFVGGGVGVIVYDAIAEGPNTLVSETAALSAIEPVVGVEFFANKKIRLGLSVKYSFQVVSADDLDLDLAIGEPLDVDMTGLYSTVSLAFMWGE